MKIAHEAPLYMMHTVREYTDYDYALGHMFHINPYFDFFRESLKSGRKVILDNGLYELGKSMVEEEFIEQINRLQPTEYIVPDVFNDKNATLLEAEKWQKYKNKLPGKQIVVIQGETYKDIIECYLRADKLADKLAFNFMCPAYENTGRTLLGLNNIEHKWLAIAVGRSHIINKMEKAGFINTSKPHHILGCAVPQEFGAYKDYKWIETIDTSNPIVYAMDNKEVFNYGKTIKKSSKKIADMLVQDYNEGAMQRALYCIGKFKSYTETIHNLETISWNI